MPQRADCEQGRLPPRGRHVDIFQMVGFAGKWLPLVVMAVITATNQLPVYSLWILVFPVLTAFSDYGMHQWRIAYVKFGLLAYGLAIGGIVAFVIYINIILDCKTSCPDFGLYQLFMGIELLSLVYCLNAAVLCYSDLKRINGARRIPIEVFVENPLGTGGLVKNKVPGTRSVRLSYPSSRLFELNDNKVISITPEKEESDGKPFVEVPLE
uniref:Transmembrane protein n=1 Tax=Steinernema glaseri TaxID=37863 RepID=A0A1I8A4G1_9BILA